MDCSSYALIPELELVNCSISHISSEHPSQAWGPIGCDSSQDFNMDDCDQGYFGSAPSRAPAFRDSRMQTNISSSLEYQQSQTFQVVSQADSNSLPTTLDFNNSKSLEETSEHDKKPKKHKPKICSISVLKYAKLHSVYVQQKTKLAALKLRLENTKGKPGENLVKKHLIARRMNVLREAVAARSLVRHSNAVVKERLLIFKRCKKGCTCACVCDKYNKTEEYAYL